MIFLVVGTCIMIYAPHFIVEQGNLFTLDVLLPRGVKADFKFIEPLPDLDPGLFWS